MNEPIAIKHRDRGRSQSDLIAICHSVIGAIGHLDLKGKAFVDRSHNLIASHDDFLAKMPKKRPHGKHRAARFTIPKLASGAESFCGEFKNGSSNLSLLQCDIARDD